MRRVPSLQASHGGNGSLDLNRLATGINEARYRTTDKRIHYAQLINCSFYDVHDEHL